MLCPNFETHNSRCENIRVQTTTNGLRMRKFFLGAIAPNFEILGEDLPFESNKDI